MRAAAIAHVPVDDVRAVSPCARGRRHRPASVVGGCSLSHPRVTA